MRNLLLITCLAACGGAKAAPSGGNVTMTRGLGGGDGAPPGGGGAAPSCEGAAEHVATVPQGLSKLPLNADQTRMGKLAYSERCTEDKWSVDVQKCLMAASTRDEVGACRKQLPPEQRGALTKDLRERVGRTHTGADQPKAVNMSADPCEGGE